MMWMVVSRGMGEYMSDDSCELSSDFTRVAGWSLGIDHVSKLYRLHMQ